MTAASYSSDSSHQSIEALFTPYQVHDTVYPNRIVMAPMGRLFNDERGVPSSDYVPYFRRRAEGGTGLIMAEGAMVPHPVAAYAPNAAAFHGDEALAVWKRCVDEVHAAGGCFMPQIWHGGLFRKPLEFLLPGEPVPVNPHLTPVGPSGWNCPNVAPDGTVLPFVKVAEPMSERDIEDVILAFGEAAANAVKLGCDGIDIHGAHGYLIDQFMWHKTNQRNDRWGGDIAGRVRFAVEVVKECRRRGGSKLPIFFRLSQWKQCDYGARLAHTPAELEQFLLPLADAGVDVFDASTRRIWEPEFEGDPRTLTAWMKHITGKGAMAVGSVGVDKDLNPNDTYDQIFKATKAEEEKNTARPASLDKVMEMFDKGWFDLVGVGRALITDPAWASKVRQGRFEDVEPYSPTALGTLV